jgi:hypothetical protein
MSIRSVVGSRAFRHAIVLAASVAAGTACAGNRLTPEQDGQSAVLCVDGLRMNAGNRSLADLLNSRIPTRRWLSDGRTAGRGPLVLIDGLEVDGITRLTTIPASHVRWVETLDGFRAVPEYGPRARTGAVLGPLRTDRPVRAAPRNRQPQRCS